MTMGQAQNTTCHPQTLKNAAIAAIATPSVASMDSLQIALHAATGRVTAETVMLCSQCTEALRH